MEQRDYLMRQIQMMGLFLQKLISRMLKRKEDGETDEILGTIKSEFQMELGLDFDELVTIESEAFFSILKEKHFTEKHLEDLAQFFFLLGQDGIEFSLQKKNFLQRALDIYLKLEKESGNFSLERNNRIVQILQLQNQ